MILFSAVLKGRPGIKKNGKRLFLRGKRPIVATSQKFQIWERDATLQLMQAKTQTSAKLPLSNPINLSCKFYFTNHQWEVDLSNAFQGIEDVLQKIGVIENDKQVYSVNGSRKIFGSKEDYVEIEITPLIFEPELK